jgi:hypothetical protein
MKSGRLEAHLSHPFCMVGHMIRAGRSSNSSHHVTAAGLSVRLFDQTWWCHARVRSFGVGGTYRRPHVAEVGGRRYVFRDHVVWARTLGTVLVLLALLARRRT